MERVILDSQGNIVIAGVPVYLAPWTASPPTPATKYTEQSDKENSWILLELCLKLIQLYNQID